MHQWRFFFTAFSYTPPQLLKDERSRAISYQTFTDKCLETLLQLHLEENWKSLRFTILTVNLWWLKKIVLQLMLITVSEHTPLCLTTRSCNTKVYNFLFVLQDCSVFIQQLISWMATHLFNLPSKSCLCLNKMDMASCFNNNPRYFVFDKGVYLKD